MALNMHLGSFEKKYRKWGASARQVSSTLSLIRDDLMDIESEGASGGGLIDQIAALVQSRQQPDTGNDKKATLDDVVAMLSSQQQDIKELQSKYAGK